MYTAIKTYCENESTNNGLFLIDMPTGFGKTFSVLKYIFDACQKEENKKRRYFFITPLKKNLPIDELKQHFEDAGKLTEFHEKVLFIDSNVDTVIENHDNELDKIIPDEIKKSEEYRTLQQELAFLKQQKNSPNSQLRQMAKGIERNFRERTEPAFRRMLQGMLAREYSTVTQRIQAIKTDNRWKWLGKLYPAVFTQEHQIFFMSMDKFLARNATIVEPSYQFYNNKLIDDSIIFIDEFDSTKETMLKNIIQNGLRDKIDFIELFKSIYSAMETNDFPAILTTSSKQRMDSPYRTQSLQKVLDDTRKKAEEIHAAYTLQFNHRTAEDAEDTFKNFLFQDHQFHSILSDDHNKFITTVSDSKAKINAIHFTPDNPKAENQNIQIMLGKLRGFIQWFQGMVNILAINYRQLKNERRQNGEDEFTQEQAIRTVLSLFRLSPYETDYLTSQVMMASRKSKSEQIAGSEFDRTLYEHGFRYYSFENDTRHDMQSKIMMCSFQNTPEKLLLRFCERAKVIGISATATVPTVVGNFDLEYLQSKMQKTFYTMPPADKQRLQNAFKDSQIGYRNIQIHTDLIGAQNYSMQTWINIFSDKELAEHVYNELECSLSDSRNQYHHERYARIAIAFKKFLMHEDIRSMLCLLTKYPSNNDKVLNLNLLKKILNLISKSVGSSFSAEKQVVVLKGIGEEFDNEKDKILNRLASGEKLFVISVYQAIGAGQNLQYPIPTALKDKLIQSNTYPPRKEKDFDAIYLDQPTNLFVNMEDNWEEEKFAKYLFQVEFLQENGELSMKDALDHIRKAFRCYQNGSKPDYYPKSVKDKKSVRLYATRTVIQAIGRICRTNMKGQNIYIFADDRIADYLDLSVTNGHILNHEFLALTEKIKYTQTKLPEQISLEDKASLISNRASRDIDYILHDGWNEKRMEKWSTLRRLVLQYPTVSADEAAKNFIYWNYYVQLPKKANMLFYSQEEDFHNINVSFTQTQLIHFVLNESNTRLNRLMQWQPLREYFISQNYATEFIPNDYIISPPLWNNIYKGALGEITGQFWFKHIFDVQLEEITDPEQFELFDFKVPEKSIYVDFKNWNESTEMPSKDTVNKIKRKAEKCGCKCAIIANVLTFGNFDIKNYTMDNIKLLIIPSLLNDTGAISINEEAVKMIWGCLNDYGN